MRETTQLERDFFVLPIIDVDVAEVVLCFLLFDFQLLNLFLHGGSGRFKLHDDVDTIHDQDDDENEDDGHVYLYSPGLGSFSHDGSTPQISRAYSAIVRSLENLPLEAMLLIDISSHLDWF